MNELRLRARHLLKQANEHEQRTGTIPYEIIGEWNVLMERLQREDYTTFNALRDEFVRTAPKTTTIKYD